MAPKNYTDTFETQAFPISEISCALQTFLDADFRCGYRFINEDRAPRAAFVEFRPILLGNLLKLIFRDHYWDGPLTVSLSSDTETWSIGILLPKSGIPSRAVLTEYVKVGKEAGFTCVAETAAGGIKILLSGEILPPPSSFYARGKGELYRILSEIYHQ